MKGLIAAIFVIAIAASTFSHAASVRSTVFTVDIEGKLRRPDGTCPDGAFRCGQGEIDGYGSAEWRFYIASFAPSSESCGDYTAIVTFTLSDGSTLTLDEAGTVCGPGKSFFATPGFSWGNPDEAIGAWEVQSGTGQFSSVTGGTGTNHARSAGAPMRALYAGTLDD